MIDLKKLYAIQRGLMDRIEKEHPTQIGEKRFPKKVLALIVELAETAQETRCFKFWSYKGSNEKRVVLEEIVDVLHFILELGIDKGFDQMNLNIEPFKIKGYEPLTNQFLSLNHSILIFSFEPTRINYIDVLELYFGLVEMIGFTDEEIVTAYMAKNEKNHERQDNKY